MREGDLSPRPLHTPLRGARSLWPRGPAPKGLQAATRRQNEEGPLSGAFFVLCARGCLVSGHRGRMSRDIVNGSVGGAGMSRDIVDGGQVRGAHQSRDRPGTLLPASRRALRRVQIARAQAAPSLARRGRERVRTAVQAAPLESAPHPGDGPRPDRGAAGRVGRRRAGCRRGHDHGAARPRGRHDLAGHRLAGPDRCRESRPAAAEASPLIVAPVRRGPTQRALAIRLHPRVPHHRAGRRGDRLAR